MGAGPARCFVRGRTAGLRAACTTRPGGSSAAERQTRSRTVTVFTGRRHGLPVYPSQSPHATGCVGRCPVSPTGGLWLRRISPPLRHFTGSWGRVGWSFLDFSAGHSCYELSEAKQRECPASGGQSDWGAGPRAGSSSGCNGRIWALSRGRPGREVGAHSWERRTPGRGSVRGTVRQRETQLLP